MTGHDLSFNTFLSAAQIQRAEKLAADLHQRIANVPTTEFICALGLALADNAVKGIGNAQVNDEDRATWDIVRQLIDNMRNHIAATAIGLKPQTRRKRPLLTTNLINVLRALARYGHAVTLSTVESVSHIDRRSIHNGAQAALRDGYVTRECRTMHQHFYKLTPLGRDTLAEYDAQQATRQPIPARFKS